MKKTKNAVQALLAAVAVSVALTGEVSGAPRVRRSYVPPPEIPSVLLETPVPARRTNNPSMIETSEIRRQVQSAKYGLDRPVPTRTDIAVKRYIVCRKHGKDLKELEHWRSVSLLHVNSGARVVKTLDRLDDQQVIEFPADQAEQLAKAYAQSGLFASIEPDMEPTDVGSWDKRASEGRFINNPDPYAKYNAGSRVPFSGNPSGNAAATYGWHFENTGQSNVLYAMSGGSWVQSGTPEPADTNASLHINEARAAYPDLSAAGVRVCLIDLGIKYDHPDLAGALMTNEIGETVCISTWQPNGGGPFVVTTNVLADIGPATAHGTEMAGLIAARANNGIGSAGVAPDCELLFAKTTTLAISEDVMCFNFAIANKARIVIGAWGYPAYSAALSNAVFAAEQAGIICFFAAVNTPSDYDSPSFHDYPIDFMQSPSNPGGRRNIVAVTSTLGNDKILTGGAGYGSHTIDFGAPGRRLPTTGWDTNYPYVYVSGTSGATVLAASCAAILMHQYPEEGMQAIINRLHGGVDPGPAGDLITQTRAGGRLNLRRALDFRQLVLSIATSDYGPVMTVTNTVAGKYYTVQTSTDLFTWSDFQSFTATGESYDVLDELYYADESKFYRVVQ